MINTKIGFYLTNKLPLDTEENELFEICKDMSNYDFYTIRNINPIKDDSSRHTITRKEYSKIKSKELQDEMDEQINEDIAYQCRQRRYLEEDMENSNTTEQPYTPQKPQLNNW